MKQATIEINKILDGAMKKIAKILAKEVEDNFTDIEIRFAKKYYLDGKDEYQDEFDEISAKINYTIYDSGYDFIFSDYVFESILGDTFNLL